MPAIFHQLSLFSLSLLLVLSSAPFQLSPTFTKAHASDEEKEKTKADQIKELREAFLNPETKSSDLDPFSLISQIVVDDRKENIEAVVKEEKLQDYNDRVEHFENELKELKELQSKVKSKISTESSPRKLAELRTVLSDIESRKKITKIEIEDLKDFDPKKSEGLPLDHMVDEDIKKRHYWGRSLKIIISNEDNEKTTLKQQDFTQSFSPHFSTKNPVSKMNKSNTNVFEIATPKGKVLHKFLKPIDAIFFYGQFLVFVEKNSYDSKTKNQNIKFIDLKYFRANIGNSPLPVYNLPVKADVKPRSFEIKKGNLFVGEQKISHPQIDILSKTQRIMFNVNAALVDPSTYDNAKPLIKEILKFFETSMNSQEVLLKKQMNQALNSSNFLNGISTDLETLKKIQTEKSEILLKEALRDGKVSDSEYEKIKSALKIRSNTNEANQATFEGKKFFTRLKLLIRFLVQSRPEGAPKIFRSLLIIATKGKNERSRVLDFAKNSFAYKISKYGLGAGAVLFGAASISPAISNQLYLSLDLISATYQHYIGYLEHIDYGRNYAELSKDAFITSVSGWTYIFESYFSDGKWPKFLYGLGSVLMIPITLFSTIHVVANSYKILLKTFEVKKLSPKEERSFLKSFIKASAFENKAYWDSRSEAEKNVSGSDVDKMNREDLTLLEEHISRVKSKKDKLSAVKKDINFIYSPRRRALRDFKENLYMNAVVSVKLLSFGNFIDSLFKKVTAKLNLKNEDSLTKALSNAFLSYSSLTTTFRINSTIWNFLYVGRSFAFSPTKWLMFLIYPNYFQTAISQESKKQHFPSKYNGGLELWPQKLRRIGSWITNKSSLTENLFLSEDSLNALKTFEKSVTKMESVAMELSFKNAQTALIESIDDPKRLLKIFDSSTREGTTTTGIQNLHDKKIKDLTKKERLFFRAYYTKSFDAIMQNFILKTTNTGVDKSLDPDSFAKAFAKELRSNDKSLDFSGKDLKSIKKTVESEVDFKSIRNWSIKISNGGSNFAKKLNINFRSKLLGSIEPGNGQISRFLTAREKVKDIRAMGRATREEVTSLVSSIPIGILSMLSLYAGVQTGVLQPFDPNGLNSETHYLYMSKFLFYNGFIPGIIVSLMANTWYKVQMDAKIDAVGGFDKAISIKSSQKGFWRYYLKNFFKNPENKWKSNQIFMLKLLWSNIPAAAVTILAAQAYGLQRIDPGVFLSGYVMAFAAVLTGLNMKTNQAFELATSWVYEKVPRRFRAHPKAQKYIEVQVQKRRIYFGWFENLWEFVVQENIAGDMLTLKDNAAMGTRSFLRLMFGGETLTGVLTNFADKLASTLQAVPGVEPVLDKFKDIISYNFEAFERYPENLSQLPESERLYENPDLPKNAIGEFIGKAAGLVTSFGIFAWIPYIGADLHQAQHERKIQKKGKKLKGSALRCSSFL